MVEVDSVAYYTSSDTDTNETATRRDIDDSVVTDVVTGDDLRIGKTGTTCAVDTHWNIRAERWYNGSAAEDVKVCTRESVYSMTGYSVDIASNSGNNVWTDRTNSTDAGEASAVSCSNGGC